MASDFQLVVFCFSSTHVHMTSSALLLQLLCLSGGMFKWACFQIDLCVHFITIAGYICIYFWLIPYLLGRDTCRIKTWVLFRRLSVPFILLQLLHLRLTPHFQLDDHSDLWISEVHTKKFFCLFFLICLENNKIFRASFKTDFKQTTTGC